MEEVKISIIVPIYNVAERLEKCLNSLMAQTCRDIEILCAEDASQDGSRDILMTCAKKDSRIVPLLHEKNLGTSMMRKEAVLASRGKYIMFADGDDFLESNACERAYQAIEENGTDILQFGVDIINCTGVPEERIESNRKLVKPCTERYEDINLISLVWREKKFRFTLWNKIYRGDICRRAFEKVEDGYFPKAQDLYAFFLIAYYSKSTAGISDILYHYNFGVGVTGSDRITIEKFEVLLQESRVYDALERFLQMENQKEEYADVLAEIKNGFLYECVNKYLNNLRQEGLSAGFRRLAGTWGYEDVICMMADKYWTNRALVAQKMSEVEGMGPVYGSAALQMEKKWTGSDGKTGKEDFERKGKRRRTIAAYYRSIRNGGAQRVVAELCNIWHRMRDEEGKPLYHVILITDGEKLEDEYSLDEGIDRCFLPRFDVCTKEKYRDRYRAWMEILSEQKIDFVVDSMWMAPCTLFDMLCIRCHESRPTFLMHAHSFCSVLYQYEGNNALAQIYLYQMCDGVVTLSECDKNYVSAFCRHVAYIPNPVSVVEQIEDENKADNILIWVGRFTSEKRPQDAVYMMEYVVKSCPNAVLYMVGDGNEEILNRLSALIRELNLAEHVILTGFQTNVNSYYEKASVCIGTSEYEGFSLTICEAFSHAIPVVSYDLPWLTVMRDGRGIVPVKQGRPDLLAEEVVKLLQNPEKLKKLGKEGRKQVEELADIDQGSLWKMFFDEVAENDTCEKRISSEAILYQYLTIFQQEGKNKIESSKQRIMKEKTEISRQLRWTEKGKDKLNEKLQQTYLEKSEISAELRRTEKERKKIQVKLEEKQREKNKLDEKLQETERKREELNEKLQKTYREKSEINAKLQQTYREKSERGEEIKRLRNSRDYRIGHMILWLPRKVKSLFSQRK